MRRRYMQPQKVDYEKLSKKLNEENESLNVENKRLLAEKASLLIKICNIELKAERFQAALRVIRDRATGTGVRVATAVLSEEE